MHPITKRLVQFKLGFPNNNMDLIDEINYKLSRMPNVRKIDPRQLPCQFCEHDFYARKEMLQVLSLNKDNSNFIKELMAVYHTILHCDIALLQGHQISDGHSNTSQKGRWERWSERGKSYLQALQWHHCEQVYIWNIYDIYHSPYLFGGRLCL